MNLWTYSDLREQNRGSLTQHLSLDIQRERLCQTSRHSLIVTPFQMEGLSSTYCFLFAFLGHYLEVVNFHEDGWRQMLEEDMQQNSKKAFFLPSPSSGLMQNNYFHCTRHKAYVSATEWPEVIYLIRFFCSSNTWKQLTYTI